MLTTILSGSLEASTAITSGHMIVDNISKLVILSKSFNINKQAFEQFKSKHKGTVEEIQQQQQDNAAIGLALTRYLQEVLGEDNRVVKLLKACTSATISPAIIELKFALGGKA
jgi:hypothetical protein